jgi:hypothetical protein
LGEKFVKVAQGRFFIGQFHNHSNDTFIVQRQVRGCQLQVLPLGIKFIQRIIYRHGNLVCTFVNGNKIMNARECCVELNTFRFF